MIGYNENYIISNTKRLYVGNSVLPDIAIDGTMRGVFTDEDIKQGELIYQGSIVEIPSQNIFRDTILNDYCANARGSGDPHADPNTTIIGLGYCSLLNAKEGGEKNLNGVYDHQSKSWKYYATRNIKAAEELYNEYGWGYWASRNHLKLLKSYKPPKITYQLGNHEGFLIDITHNNNLIIKKSTIDIAYPHRGVFTKTSINVGEVIEKAPIVILEKDKISGTEINQYVFEYDEDNHMFVFGNGLLYNHSNNHNVKYKIDKQNKVVIYKAERNILPKEELFINYDKLWMQRNNIDMITNYS